MSKKIIIPVISFALGILFVFSINGRARQGLLDKYPILYINSPKGYEIQSGYMEPYFNDSNQLRWRNKKYKKSSWYPTLEVSGSAIFTKDTADDNVVIFIRKK